MHFRPLVRRALVGTMGALLLVAGCGAPTPPVPPAGVPVMGASRLTAAQLVAYYRAKAPAGYSATVPLETLAQYYVDEGNAEGVRGDIAFFQALVETGWFVMPTNPNAMVPNTYNNFAGIGACDTCVHGYQFETAQLGVRRQIQALRNLADPSSRVSNLANPPASSGIRALDGSWIPGAPWPFDSAWRKGKAPTWNQMGGVQPDGYINWASASNYADVILGLYSKALTFSGLSGECPPDGLNLGTTAATGRCPASIAQPGRSLAMNPLGGYYVLNGDGTVKGYNGATNYGSPRFTFDIARDLAVMPDGKGYVVLDGYGGLHLYGSATKLGSLPGAYWKGWDIARSIAITPTGNGFVVLDGFGGLHPAGDAPLVAGGPYWSGWDIARSIVIRYDNQGYWVLDGYGGVHTLRTGAVPAGQDDRVGGTAGFTWDIARDLVVLQSGYGFAGAYVIDGFGGVHPSASGALSTPRTITGGAAADRWRAIGFDMGTNKIFALRNDGVVSN